MYRIFRQECYGGGGVFGHKIWVSLAETPDKKALAVLTTKLSDKARALPVLLNSQSFAATEVTVFVYYGRQPETDKDNWLADKVLTAPL